MPTITGMGATLMSPVKYEAGESGKRSVMLRGVVKVTLDLGDRAPPQAVIGTYVAVTLAPPAVLEVRYANIFPSRPVAPPPIGVPSELFRLTVRPGKGAPLASRKVISK